MLGEKESKDNILEDIVSYDNLKATGWRVFVMHERASQRSGQESCFFGSH